MGTRRSRNSLKSLLDCADGSGTQQSVCWIKLARSRTFVLPKLGESRLPQAALFPPILRLPNITLDHSRHSQL